MGTDSRHQPREHVHPLVDLDDPRRLAAATRLLAASGDNPVVTRLSALASHLLSAASAQVSLVTSSTSVVAGYGEGARLAGGPAFAREDSLCARVVAGGLPLLLHDDATSSPAAASYLGVPLMGAEGLPVGAVCVYDARPRLWLSRDVLVVEELSEAVGAELERVAVETERNVAEQSLVALMATASDALAVSLDPDDAVRSLARLAVPALADWSVVTLLDEAGRPHDVEWWHRDPAHREVTAEFARHRLVGRTEPVGSLASLADGEVFTVASGVLAVADAALRSDVARRALAVLAPGSVTVVPIASRGRVDGTITLARDADRPAMSDSETAAASDLGRRASVALAHARRYHRQRTTSEQLQRSMLTAPVVPAGTELEVRYLPATDDVRVGGDWYDAFPMPDRSTALVVGDVAGHDVAAAAAMAQVRSILRGLAVTTSAPAGEVLDLVDEALDALRSEVQATALMCRLEPVADDGAGLSWAGAGHVPALVVAADGRTRLLPAGGVMLGVGSIHSRREHHTRLEPGDTLLLLTDGLVERRDTGVDAGIARLHELASSLADRPLSCLVDEVLHVMLADGHEDDVALLAVRLTSASPVVEM